MSKAYRRVDVKRLFAFVATLLWLSAPAGAVEPSAFDEIQERLLKIEALVRPADAEVPWSERILLRGYTQLRYNRLLENNENLRCDQCDRSMGRGGNFFVRRARLVFGGDVHDRVYVYIQPDFASDASATSLHFTQLRDLYFDVFLDQAKEFRVRLGQSKVPFGFENLQSSQNRLALDRTDALNSGVANERDLGVFFYWAPQEIRKRFSALVASGLKGSGDYGVIGFGAYNGQTANRPEANESLHMAARVTYPFRTEGGQYIETGVSGYMGRVVVPAANRTAGLGGPFELHDERIAYSLTIYPQPLGFQAEYNNGMGPEFVGPSRSVEQRKLEGGYVQTMYMFRRGDKILTPYVRGQYYKGGKKQEQDARRYLSRELEGGLEWQPHRNLELVVAYAHADRAYEDLGTRGNRQKGGRMRVQVQINF